jgi:hypothetical protein
MGVMGRIGIAALAMALAGATWPTAGEAGAQSAPAGVRLAQAAPPEAPPRVVRSRERLRIYPYRPYDYWPHDVYPRHDLPPDAVRECNATYVQEFRPSGTVIVPRMSCHWRRG